MKRPRILLALCILLCALCIPSTAAIVEQRWTANVAAPAAAQFPVGRGETVALRCDLVGADGRPFALPDGATAALWWQTNGMDNAWWTAPATVSNATIRATWLPEYDPGAPLVRAFLGVSATNGAAAWRAFANLRFYGTPGADPDTAPLPDGAMERVPVAAITNAPWARAVADSAARAASDSATNAVSDLLALTVADNPDAALEVYRLVLADLWARVDAIETASGAPLSDRIDDIAAAAERNRLALAALSALHGSDAAALALRVSSLESAAAAHESRIQALESGASPAADPAALLSVPDASE